MNTLDNLSPSSIPPRQSGSGLPAWAPKLLGGFALAAGLLGLALLGLLLSQTPLAGLGSWLLSIDSGHATWYITRAAGITAYLLLWLSTAWGLAVSNRILDGRLHGAYTYDFHQFISLLSIGFLGLHLVVLLFDQYLTFTLPQLLLPFLSSYRPLWVGLGVISFYLIVLVTVTFYLRDRIGAKAFRGIHTLSLVAFLGAAVHGLLSGTDSPLGAVRIMYALTFLSVVFLLVYWLANLGIKKLLHQK